MGPVTCGSGVSFSGPCLHALSGEASLREWAGLAADAPCVFVQGWARHPRYGLCDFLALVSLRMDGSGVEVRQVQVCRLECAGDASKGANGLARERRKVSRGPVSLHLVLPVSVWAELGAGRRIEVGPSDFVSRLVL